MAKSFARTFAAGSVKGDGKGGTTGDRIFAETAKRQVASHPAVPGRGTSGLAESSGYTKSARVEPKFKGGLATGLMELRAAEKVGETTAYQGQETSGTSIFDPVLTELAYTWFCPPGGWILDPFAGGSVRGIVASFLGRRYVGIDLRAEQIAANEKQAQQICAEPLPTWITGDSRDLPVLCEGLEADMVFSCPPYADLERYSDNPQDISTLSYRDFLPAYAEIIQKACALLKPNRFAAFVVGDVRGKDGFYYNFPAHTTEAFAAAGLRLYNDAVLITAVGSLPVRVGKQFRSGRKLGRTHQSLLVFVKGDWKIAAAAMEDSK